jgi:hypothetical protein
VADFETPPIGTGAKLERLTDALDHIMRICHMSVNMSKRTYWIAQRAQSALENDEKWREFDYPVNRKRQEERLRERLKAAEARIKELENDQA